MNIRYLIDLLRPFRGALYGFYQRRHESKTLSVWIVIRIFINISFIVIMVDKEIFILMVRTIILHKGLQIIVIIVLPIIIIMAKIILKEVFIMVIIIIMIIIMKVNSKHFPIYFQNHHPKKYKKS